MTERFERLDFNERYRQISVLPFVATRQPQEAADGTLNKFVWRRLYQSDPYHIPGGDIPYIDVLNGALAYSEEAGGDLHHLIPLVSHTILSNIRESIEHQSATPADMTALSNLTLLVKHFSSAPRLNDMSDHLKAIEPLLPPTENLRVRVLDALNCLPARPEDVWFWFPRWNTDSDESGHIWTTSFIGLNRTSPSQGIKVIPMAVERSDNGWDSHDAFWNFYWHYLRDEKGQNAVAKQLRKVSAIFADPTPRAFKQVIDRFSSLLVEAGADPKHIEALGQAYFVNHASWNDLDEYYKRKRIETQTKG